MKILTLIRPAILAGALLVTPLFAQNESFRGGTSEFFGSVTFWTAPTITARDVFIPDLGTNDVVMNIKDTELFGLGGGYNIDEHWNIWGDIQFGSPRYQANWGDEILSGKADLFTGRINVDYNFWDKTFTPFVTAGMGFTYIDSNVPSGDPAYWCWWDYYWGWVCDGNQPTHDKWSFSPNAGAGLRWDVAEGFFLKAMANWTWAEVGEGGYKAFPQATLNVGWTW